MAKLGLKIQAINIKTQKIDSSIVKIFEIALASFQIDNMLN